MFIDEKNIVSSLFHYYVVSPDKMVGLLARGFFLLVLLPFGLGAPSR
jgi:hypothetical protein